MSKKADLLWFSSMKAEKAPEPYGSGVDSL